MVVRCKAQTAGGAPCSAQPVRDDGFCYWHSPATASERVEARRRGGQNRSTKARARKQIPVAMSADELAGWLSLLFTQVMAGRIEPRVATAAATVAKTLMDVRQASELEERLAALETQAAGP